MENTWGNITWVMLHTFSVKIKEDIVTNKKEEILNFINLVILNIPCLICRLEANNYIKINNLSSINNKNDLIIYLFNFHNYINLRLKKKIRNFDYINRYLNTNSLNIFNLYLKQPNINLNIYIFLNKSNYYYE